MTTDYDDSFNNEKTYYHTNEHLNGWIIHDMYPIVSSMSPLIGKKFTNVNQELLPVTETTSPIKRRLSHVSSIAKPDQSKKPMTSNGSGSTLSIKTKTPSSITAGSNGPKRTLPSAMNNNSKRNNKKSVDLYNPSSNGSGSISSTTASPANSESKSLRRQSPFTTNNINIDSEKSVDLYSQLSDEQKRIHDSIVKDKVNIFFTGSAGTGKSVLLRAIISTLKSIYLEDEVVVTASTGIAALNIGGITIHKFAHVNLGNEHVNVYIESIKNSVMKMRTWNKVKVLVVDEISMIDGQLLDKLEEIARRIRRCNKPFGGIQLVFCGDFFQLPPVDQHQIKVLAFEAKCWKRVIDKNMILHRCFRQKDQRFAQMLNELRIGNVSKETERVFQSLSRLPKSNIDVLPTELYPIRAKVDAANDGRLKLLEGQSHIFRSVDQGNKAILSRCIAPAELTLKIGAQVMLIKNLSQKLINGSIGIVTGFFTEKSSKVYPIVKFSDGSQQTLYEETWKYNLPGLPLISRRQIPLILAWALSIHKAQGQTIEYVKVDLDKAFEQGQVYTALSRATRLENLQVLNFRKSLVKVDDKVIQFYKHISNDA